MLPAVVVVGINVLVVLLEQVVASLQCRRKQNVKRVLTPTGYDTCRIRPDSLVESPCSVLML
jgi:hypothetical protein